MEKAVERAGVPSHAIVISGVVGSRSTQLQHIVSKVPDGTKEESRVKLFARWIDMEIIAGEIYFVPYAKVLLRHVARQHVYSREGWGGSSLWVVGEPRAHQRPTVLRH